MIGQRFGRLVVLERAESNGRQAKWKCQCDCGRISTPFGFSLKSGDSKSCGCVAAEKSKERWKNPTPDMRAKLGKHAITHNMSKHKAFRAWTDMKTRCLHKKSKWYPSYGGRGITICQRWLDGFIYFWEDMGPAWFEGATLGRIDNNGNYEPSNVRWETARQQQRNKSNTLFIDTPQGKRPISEVCDETGLSRNCIVYRIKAGWPMEKLFQSSQRSDK